MAFKRQNSRSKREFTRELCHTALRLEPNDPVAKRSLAYALISNNQMAEAKLIADDIIKQTPNDPFAMMLSRWVLS
jgi:predicted Zn-dependent protease